jgi:hypothetical protein
VRQEFKDGASHTSLWIELRLSSRILPSRLKLSTKIYRFSTGKTRRWNSRISAILVIRYPLDFSCWKTGPIQSLCKTISWAKSGDNNSFIVITKHVVCSLIRWTYIFEFADWPCAATSTLTGRNDSQWKLEESGARSQESGVRRDQVSPFDTNKINEQMSKNV